MVTMATSHKDAAVSFLHLASSGNVRDAFDRYVDRAFRHHNPYFAGDAKSLADGMADNAAKFPKKSFHVERTIEQGNLVAVHSRVQLSPDTPEMALVHIFRFEGDRVVELWDIGQPTPAEMRNEHGMF
jgi:predicted SnoaL-like aldol condensation-catalyzing enzyme